MKLTFFTLTFIVINLFTGYSQNTNKGLIYYGEIQSIDRGPKNGPDMLSTLVFNSSQSCYTTKKDSLNSLSYEETKDFYADNKNGGTFFGGGVPSNEYGYQVFLDLVKDTIWSSFQRVDYYYVKEKKSVINWKLEKETKKIGNYTCHKAIGTLRGREYIAWYAPTIPVPYGPWKLQGLPGLILEAYTANEEIYFYVKKIEYPTQSNITISKIKKVNNSKWLTFPEYLITARQLINNSYNQLILLGTKPENIFKSEPINEFKEFEE
jgi:GLPGLI family protein